MVEKALSAMGKLWTATDAHPAVAAGSGIALAIVALMQSAQEVVSTVIAVVTSLTGLVVAIMGLRSAFKKWRK